eukprot:scaffold7825_cov87-Cylindrotheca_fusiformis.AAC.1
MPPSSTRISPADLSSSHVVAMTAPNEPTGSFAPPSDPRISVARGSVRSYDGLGRGGEAGSVIGALPVTAGNRRKFAEGRNRGGLIEGLGFKFRVSLATPPTMLVDAVNRTWGIFRGMGAIALMLPRCVAYGDGDGGGVCDDRKEMRDGARFARFLCSLRLVPLDMAIACWCDTALSLAMHPVLSVYRPQW